MHRPMYPRLFAITGPLTDSIFPLPGGDAILGREPSNALSPRWNPKPDEDESGSYPHHRVDHLVIFRENRRDGRFILDSSPVCLIDPSFSPCWN